MNEFIEYGAMRTTEDDAVHRQALEFLKFVPGIGGVLGVTERKPGKSFDEFVRGRK